MSELKPIEIAPKDRDIMLIIAGTVRKGRWNKDEYAKKPRPYWEYPTLMGKNYLRKNQPTHWMPLPDLPK